MMFSVFLFVLLLPIHATFGILLFLFALFRYAVGIILRLKTGMEIEFLTGTEALFNSVIGKHKPHVQILYKMKGEIDINWIRSRILHSLNSDYKNFSRFYKYVKCYFGYFYWQREENFNIEDHVVLLNCDPPSNDQELNILCAKIVNEHVEQCEKSPWIIHVFPLSANYLHFPSHYVIEIIYNHSISDGFGYIKFFEKTFLQSEEINFISRNNKWTFNAVFETFLAVFVNIPKRFYDIIVNRDDNLLCGLRQIGVRVLSNSSSVSLDRIRKIKTSIGCTANDLLLTCFVGAVIKYFKRQKLPLPKRIRCSIPITFRRPEDPILSNQISMNVFHFPLNSATPMHRLKDAVKQMKNFKNSFNVFSTKLEDKCLSLMPKCVLSMLSKRIVLTLTFSYVICPSQTAECDGLLKFSGFAPLGGNIGIGFGAVSHNGQVLYGAAADESIIANSYILHHILQDCIEEIKEFE